ncbi:MAG: indole-3-glycerol phosphate synthase TrpC [Anaerolineales bacterium]|nr:indole-3-glycerol phosphate synthase TrpC [Anaerolineales bacterium]
MILDDIMVHKRIEVAHRSSIQSLAALMRIAIDRPPALDLVEALEQPGVRLIAEIKRASPSRGLLCPSLVPAEMARTYATHGASAISVLTDEHFFQGSLDDLLAVKAALREAGAALPVLRKDFICDPYQVVEARAYDADAILLIVAALSDDTLGELLALSRALGMAALVEVHDATELRRALLHAPQVIGINNRDLRTFTVDLDTFGRLRPDIPAGIVTVAESGIHSTADVARLAEMGADAVLVGEALVTAPDVAARVRELAGGIVG